jgi:hypothetical protein
MTAFWTVLLVTSLGLTKSSEEDSCRLQDIPNNVVLAGTSVSTVESVGRYAQCYLVSLGIKRKQ